MVLLCSLALALPDRSAPPPVIPPVLMELPRGEVVHEREGLRVRFLQVDGLDRGVLEMSFGRGRVALGRDLEQTVRAASAIWDVATEASDPEAFEIRQDLVDAYPGIYIGSRFSTVSLDAPAEQFVEAVGLMDEVLTTPGWPKKELKEWKKGQRLYAEIWGPTDPDGLSGRSINWGWYEPDHPWGLRWDLDAVKKVKYGAIPPLRERVLAGPLEVAVVGPFTWDVVDEAVLDAVGDLGQPGAVDAEIEAAPGPSETAVHGVDMPELEDVRLAMRILGPDRDHGDSVPFNVVAHSFGQSGRLDAILREEKGFTYGVGVYYVYWKGGGWLDLELTVAADNLVETVGIIEAELERLAEGLDAEEIAKQERLFTTDWNRRLEHAENAAMLLTDEFHDNWTLDAQRARIERIGTLTSEETGRVAKTWLAADKPRLWTVVGAKSKVGPVAEELGWDVVWHTPQEATVGW